MHPPFGFSLFYLRSVAPRDAYADRVTGAIVAPITSGEIYWGAVPFVAIQVLMMALTIIFPIMVTHYQIAGAVNPANVKIEIAPPPAETGAPNFGTAGPNFGTSGQ
jgi:hypothetical protein